jgi:hypothetical protein
VLAILIKPGADPKHQRQQEGGNIHTHAATQPDWSCQVDVLITDVKSYYYINKMKEE